MVLLTNGLQRAENTPRPSDCNGILTRRKQELKEIGRFILRWKNVTFQGDKWFRPSETSLGKKKLG